MTPCNSCDNGKCGSCVATRLETQGHITNAKTHCGCAANGHKNNFQTTATVKTMFSKIKDDDPHVPEQEVVEE